MFLQSHYLDIMISRRYSIILSKYRQNQNERIVIQLIYVILFVDYCVQWSKPMAIDTLNDSTCIRKILIFFSSCKHTNRSDKLDSHNYYVWLLANRNVYVMKPYKLQNWNSHIIWYAIRVKHIWGGLGW
jgi:hypothetical protein